MYGTQPPPCPQTQQFGPGTLSLISLYPTCINYQLPNFHFHSPLFGQFKTSLCGNFFSLEPWTIVLLVHTSKSFTKLCSFSSLSEVVGSQKGFDLGSNKTASCNSPEAPYGGAPPDILLRRGLEHGFGFGFGVSLLFTLFFVTIIEAEREGRDVLRETKGKAKEIGE